MGPTTRRASIACASSAISSAVMRSRSHRYRSASSRAASRAASSSRNRGLAFGSSACAFTQRIRSLSIPFLLVAQQGVILAPLLTALPPVLCTRSAPALVPQRLRQPLGAGLVDLARSLEILCLGLRLHCIAHQPRHLRPQRLDLGL